MHQVSGRGAVSETAAHTEVLHQCPYHHLVVAVTKKRLLGTFKNIKTLKGRNTTIQTKKVLI